MTSNDEIYLSYLCDQILVACNRIHKKLDKYDEFLSSYTTPVISYHEQPYCHVATDTVQPRPPPDPPNGQPWNYVQPCPDQQVPTYGLMSALASKPYHQQFNPHTPEPPYGQSAYQNVGYPPVPANRPYGRQPLAPYTGQAATGMCPLTSHHRTAAPLSAAAFLPCRGCPMEAVAVVVEKDKSCSEVMLVNGKSYDGDGMPMVVPHPLAEISLPCSSDVSEEEEELFEEEPPLPAGILLPCSPNQDYNDHTSVPIELVDAMEYEHLGEGNDRIGVIGENKDRDRVYEKESLVLGEEEKRTDAFLDVEITDDPIYTMLEVMKMVEDENSLVFQANGSYFERMLPLSRRLSLEANGVYNWTEQYNIFDPGGDILPKLLFSTLFIVSWFPP